ncbi:Uncharacterised protein [uncultured archaeon]|nr:Uncharacterised protein [uncultured archaeon]
MRITKYAQYNTTTVAQFKAWGQGISTAMAALGYVQTADTGQVNWNTMVAVPSVVVFDLWQSNDGLTSYVVKWSYSAGGGVAGGAPGLSVQVGRSSDGSGTLVNATSSFNLTSGGSIAQEGGTTLYPLFFSGPGNGAGFVAMIWSGSGFPSLACVERSISGTVTASPVYNNQYVTLVIGGAASGVGTNGFANQVSLFLTGAQILGTNMTNICTLGSAGMLGGTSSIYQGLAVAGQALLLPIFPLVGWCGNPLSLLACLQGVDGGPAQVDRMPSIPMQFGFYGQTRTFLFCTGGLWAHGFNPQIPGAESRPIMRWE